MLLQCSRLDKAGPDFADQENHLRTPTSNEGNVHRWGELALEKHGPLGPDGHVKLWATGKVEEPGLCGLHLQHVANDVGCKQNTANSDMNNGREGHNACLDRCAR